MKYCIVAFALVLAATGSAGAQAPTPSEPVTADFLEKRLPEELALEGIVLSRRNLGLQVEQLADRWLVSLVDLTTGRVAASTRVDQLPADREAAVAAMTHVVAELAAQVVGHAAPGATPVAAPADDRAERQQRELAELKFRRESIRFGDDWQLSATSGTPTVHRRWRIVRGELDQELPPTEFYAVVGRNDLAEAYLRRRRIARGLFIASGVGFVTLVVLGVRQLASDGESPPSLAPPFIVGGLTIAAGGAGILMSQRLHPISENDAKSLADDYNRQLRQQLGLPVVTRRALQLKLAPYVASREAGLVLGATF
jgi:hypothetical protein